MFMTGSVVLVVQQVQFHIFHQTNEFSLFLKHPKNWLVKMMKKMREIMKFWMQSKTIHRKNWRILYHNLVRHQNQKLT
ncbi:hypothetical protein X798_05091 [Onchocerca flexuosa]|uniref:Uncharacterized protein n=1 Tax=Onchocerca flexuosa TaxID=387005 RepID=A0A238BR63_9BILA|nr:hypothetical protein X798_05091 [Onchocerca flexuosa]